MASFLLLRVALQLFLELLVLYHLIGALPDFFISDFGLLKSHRSQAGIFTFIIEPDDSELAYRRGYQAGAVETFHAVEQFLDPATREGLRAWIDDVLQWRTKAMLGPPPMWRLRIPRPSKD